MWESAHVPPSAGSRSLTELPGLQEAEVTLFRFAEGNTATYAAFFNALLDGRGVYDLLRQIGKDAFDPGLGDVAGDMVFPFLDGPEPKRLRRIHESDPAIGPAWRFFARNYKDVFLRVFAAANNWEQSDREPRILSPHLPFLTGLEARKQIAERRIRADDPFSRTLICNLFTGNGPEEERLAETLNQAERGKTQRHARKAAKRRIVSVALKKIEDYRSDTANAEDALFVERLVDEYLRERFTKHLIPDTTNEEEAAVYVERPFGNRRAKRKARFAPAHLVRPEPSVVVNGSTYTLDEHAGTFVYKLVKEAGKPDLPSLALVVLWERGEEGRLIHVHPKRLETFAQKGLGAFAGSELLERVRGGNLLAGLGVVASQSPELTAAWPKQGTLQEGKRPQFEGPLQLLIRCIVERGKLAESPLLRAWEAEFEDRKVESL